MQFRTVHVVFREPEAAVVAVFAHPDHAEEAAAAWEDESGIAHWIEEMSILDEPEEDSLG